MYLLEADQRFGLLSIQSLLFVQVENAEGIACRWESASGVRLPRDFEEEPVAVALCVSVWAQVQVELPRLHLDSQVKVA